MPTDKKFIVFRGETIELTENPDGFYHDDKGTIYSFTSADSSVDDSNHCGVGFFSLPDGHPLNAGCGSHDYAYSSPVYQAFHTRKEADKMLQSLLHQIPGYSHSITPDIFYMLSRVFGGFFWENDKTNE